MIVVVMGVAGSGKTTVGSLPARRLGWRFIEADDYHSRSEIEHMLAGQPLSDTERQPWLAKLRQVLGDCMANAQSLRISFARARVGRGGPSVAVTTGMATSKTQGESLGSPR